MRRLTWSLLGIGAAFGTSTIVAACNLFPPDDCASHLDCPDDDATASADAGDASMAMDAVGADVTKPGEDATMMAEAGSEAGPEEAGNDASDASQAQDATDATVSDASEAGVCDPTRTPHDDSCVLGVDGGGVFVAPALNGGSDTTGDGTRSHPYATIGHALSNLGGVTRVYVCDATYAEAVTLGADASASLFGGLSCPVGDAGWSYVGRTAEVNGPSNQVALRIDQAPGSVDIEDFAITAAAGVGQDDAGNGQSSIAVFVNASTVTLRRCALTAGAGANGADGVTGSNYSGTAPNGLSNDGGVGGAGGMNGCGDGTSSTGGGGGNASMTPPAGDGGNGVSNPPTLLATASSGLGGKGADGVVSCAGGNDGANGGTGVGGNSVSGVGMLTNVGWIVSAGTPGLAGTPGQGGGGGGARAQGPLLGGAGGGSGGCGGGGGQPGLGAGSSIALAAGSASVTLDSCALTTGQGGSGGIGGAGQPGQPGGSPVGSAPACSGGVGGTGGAGGGGAGGTGGVSVCVVYSGTMPAQAGTTTCTLGDAGAGGSGGASGNGAGSDAGVGATGLAGVAQSFLPLH